MLNAFQINQKNYTLSTFVSKLAVVPQVSRIFRIHILLKFEKLFLEAYRFQNSEGLEGLKEYALTFHHRAKPLSMLPKTLDSYYHYSFGSYSI